MDERARCELLERENDQLRERVRVLERAFFETSAPLPLEWRLTQQEARVFGVLANRELATKQAIHVALYGGDVDDGADIKMVDVFICRLRKKLRPHGIEIVTRRGIGWCLAARLREQFKGAA